MAKVDLKAFTAELANELGATVDDSAADWNGIVDTADGLRLQVTQSHRKGYVRAWLKRGQAFPGDTIPCGEIGATFTRGAVAVAKDVERQGGGGAVTAAWWTHLRRRPSLFLAAIMAPGRHRFAAGAGAGHVAVR